MLTDRQIKDFFVSESQRHAEMTAAIAGETQHGYPTAWLNIMEHSSLEHFASMSGYAKDPINVYRAAQERFGVSFIDQWIPTNPLSMGDAGFDSGSHSATTGIHKIILDGMEINEPEDVCEHLERFTFPGLRHAVNTFDIEARVRVIGETEYNIAHDMGSKMLKTGYAFINFPCLRYFSYGYENYFCAYALYPEVMEKDFALQAEYSVLCNKAAALAYERYKFPLLNRLDHDMTDSRGTLANIKSMAKIWFPYLAKSLEPMLKTDVKMIWHCDGNLMPMVPYLLDIGISGFQGFQYEDGMDFAEICKMRTRDNRPLFIWAGSSVTRTLPFGTPRDVKAELKYLALNHGDTTLVLGATSSITPGVSIANLEALAEGLAYYRTHTQ